MEKGLEYYKYGLAEPEFRYLHLFCAFLSLFFDEIVKNYGNPIEQTVAGYDPHVVAWQWYFPATIVYS